MAELQISRAAMQESRKILPHGNRQMKFADLERKQKLGQGAFGTVFIGYWKDWSGVVAIKLVRLANDSVQEVRMLSELKHPNIITLYGTASRDFYLYIVMELAELGSLWEHIQKSRGQPDMNSSLRWAVDIAEGMSYIHEKGFAYRDLKSSKVLLTSTRTAKICATCTAREMDHTTVATTTGTCTWMAPEVIQQAAYSKRCDVFSYGTVLWELMTHDVPFEELKGVTFRIQMAIVNGQMPVIPADVKGYFSTLIQQCWSQDPKARPSFVEVLEILKPHLEAMDVHVPAVLEPEIRKIAYEDIQFGDVIGSGLFDTVCRGHWDDRPVAIKKVSKKVSTAVNMAQEVDIMAKLLHANIVTLYGTASRHPEFCIIMELAECSLYKHIQDHKGQPDMKQSLRWATQVAKGMKYLHGKEIVHRDLKSANVLLTNDLKVAKLGDFSTARHLDDTVQATQAGTMQWMAPEVINQGAYSKRCDVFSYGIVLWELVTHKAPFEGISTLDILSAIVEGKMPVIPAEVEGYLSTLIQQCWNMDPHERPLFVEVLEVLKPHLQAMDVPAVLEPGIRKIGYEAIQFGDVIGSGSFGTVCRGHWDDRSVAIKKVSTAVNMEREVDVMAKLLHANIVTLYATASKHPEFCIIMELAECSLFSHIEKHKDQPDMELSLRWATQVAEGMKYLHGKEIVHRDLKSANVLLTNDLKVAKLCDFGIARQLDNTVQATQAGTVQWMAPEVINAKAYSKRCDLFSYGIVLWELVTHKAPFEGISTLDILNAIVAGKTPCIPAKIEAYLCSLIQQCWKVDPDERPIFLEILQVLHEKEMIPEHAIKMADLEIGNEISSGSYGEVFEGVWTLKERQVAIKRMHYDEKIMEEVRLMSELKYHANIITLYGTASRDPHLYIVMELAECSLYKHIKDHKGKPDMKRSLRWAVEVAKGMRYLHGKEIVHRDLKSPNVLLTNDLKVAKLCDFGIARHLDQIKATSIGTVKWMAPEVINEELYCETCDVFSYGTVLWELVTHEVPFDGLNAEYPIKIAITTGKMPAIPDSVEGYLSTLIQQCWNMDPKKRPSFDKMLPVLRKDQQPEDWDEEEEEEEIKADSKPQLPHLEMLPCTKTAIKVAAEIKDNWPRVARKLDMPANDRKEIKQQSSDPEQQALAMLKRWWAGDYKCDDSDDELPAPTWAILMAALVGSGYGKLADRIRQRMAPST